MSVIARPPLLPAPAAGHRRAARATLVGAVLAAVLVGTGSSAGAETPALAGHPSTPSGSVLNLGLQIGADAISRTIVWQSTHRDQTGQTAQVARAGDVVDGQLPDDARTIVPETGTSELGGLWHEATVTDLTPGDWVYRVGSTDLGWSVLHRFTVQDVSGPWSFVALGDAQLGSSGDLVADAQGWQRTVSHLAATEPDAVFWSSLGDQVNTADDLAEYAAFFAPDELRSTPFAVLNGNHDSNSTLYSHSFAHPNGSLLGIAVPQTVGDYWYRIGDVLFLSLDSNTQLYTPHEVFMRQAIAAQPTEPRWVVAQFHHSLYSSARHSEATRIEWARSVLAPALSRVGVDLVLAGHDHSYARSHLMDGTTPSVRPAGTGDELTAEDSEVLYVTLNSSSGSKYYDPVEPPHDYLAVRDQSRTPSYAVVDVRDDRLTVETVTVEDRRVIDRVTLLKSGDEAAGPPATPDDPATDDPATEDPATGDPGSDVAPVGDGGGTISPAPTAEAVPVTQVADASGTRTAAPDHAEHAVPSAFSLPATGVQATLAALAAGFSLIAAGLTLRLSGRRPSSRHA